MDIPRITAFVNRGNLTVPPEETAFTVGITISRPFTASEVAAHTNYVWMNYTASVDTLQLSIGTDHVFRQKIFFSVSDSTQKEVTLRFSVNRVCNLLLYVYDNDKSDPDYPNKSLNYSLTTNIQYFGTSTIFFFRLFSPQAKHSRVSEPVPIVQITGPELPISRDGDERLQCFMEIDTVPGINEAKELLYLVDTNRRDALVPLAADGITELPWPLLVRFEAKNRTSTFRLKARHVDSNATFESGDCCLSERIWSFKV